MSTEAERVSWEVFWKLHEGLPQQGPGSDASTRRALASVTALPGAPRILDLGCGPGRQSVVLARDTGGHVTCVDLLPAFLEQLEARARDAGVGDRVETLHGSMDDLPFDDASFDLLWSEGAIYNIGFERGLRGWHRLLRPRGCVAVTEATWLVPDPPKRIHDFWMREYPAMQDRAANERAVAAAGYTLLDTFVLPEQEWWDDYYTPIHDRIAALRKERSDAHWQKALDDADEEEEIVRLCGGSFGYVFYVMQKPGA